MVSGAVSSQIDSVKSLVFVEMGKGYTSRSSIQTHEACLLLSFLSDLEGQLKCYLDMTTQPTFVIPRDGNRYLFGIHLYFPSKQTQMSTHENPNLFQ